MPTIVTSATDTFCPAPSHSCSTRELGLFLSRYCAWLLGCGATCIRLEKNVERIAGTFGKKVEIFIMPRHINMTVWEEGSSDRFTSITTTEQTPISFNTNARLSALSWEVADGRLSLEEAEKKFRRIVTSDYQSKWLVLLLVSLANASFCRLFGGDAIAMAVVFVATMAGFWLRSLMVARHLDFRVTVFTCAFVSAVLGASDYLFSLGSTPGLAIGTSVLYLVPGIPFLNSFSDLLNRHYICAMSRFTDAAVLTACLSGGIFLAMWLMRIQMFT